MKMNQTAGKCILTGLFAYLLIQIYYLSRYTVPAASEEAWKDMAGLFLIQSVFFAACILTALILLFLQHDKEKYASPFESLLIVTGEGKIKSEILLQGQRSFAITGKKNGKEVFVETAQNIETDRYLYGICNLVNGRWYLEAASGSRPVGLKRGNESVIYKLKAEIPYQLSGTDVIYADTCKIVIRQQRNIWREQNGSDSV